MKKPQIYLMATKNNFSKTEDCSGFTSGDQYTNLNLNSNHKHKNLEIRNDQSKGSADKWGIRFTFLNGIKIYFQIQDVIRMIIMKERKKENQKTFFLQIFFQSSSILWILKELTVLIL